MRKMPDRIIKCSENEMPWDTNDETLERCWCDSCVHRQKCETNTFEHYCIMSIETKDKPTYYEKEESKCG